MFQLFMVIRSIDFCLFIPFQKNLSCRKAKKNEAYRFSFFNASQLCFCSYEYVLSAFSITFILCSLVYAFRLLFLHIPQFQELHIPVCYDLKNCNRARRLKDHFVSVCVIDTTVYAVSLQCFCKIQTEISCCFYCYDYYYCMIFTF